MNKYREIVNTGETEYNIVGEIGDEIRIKFRKKEPLTEGEIVILCLRELEDDVNNDGFLGFLLNMYAKKFFPKYFADTLNALKVIGATQTYEKFQEIYERYSDMQEYDLERLEKDSEYLHTLDRWFYQYNDNLTELQYQYILKHLI